MKVYKYRSNYDRDVISLFLNQLFAPTYDNLNDKKVTMNYYNYLFALEAKFQVISSFVEFDERNYQTFLLKFHSFF